MKCFKCERNHWEDGRSGHSYTLLSENYDLCMECSGTGIFKDINKDFRKFQAKLFVSLVKSRQEVNEP